MNPHADFDARPCPHCGLPEIDSYQPMVEADCDCQDCRGRRMREVDLMDVEEDFDRDNEGLSDRVLEDEYEDYGEDDDYEDDDSEDDDYEGDDSAEDEDLYDLLEEAEEEEDDYEEDDYEEDDYDEDDYDEDDYDGEDYDGEDDYDEEDLNDFLEADALGEDLFEDFEDEAHAFADADDYEDDLLDEGSEDAEYDGFPEDADDLEEDYAEMDRRVLKRPCSGVRRIIVRKNRDGREPLSDAQRRQICTAIQTARRWAATAEGVFNGIWNQRRRKRRRRKEAWRKNRVVVEWLGSGKLTNRQIRVMRTACAQDPQLSADRAACRRRTT